MNFADGAPALSFSASSCAHRWPLLSLCAHICDHTLAGPTRNVAILALEPLRSHFSIIGPSLVPSWSDRFSELPRICRASRGAPSSLHSLSFGRCRDHLDHPQSLIRLLPDYSGESLKVRPLGRVQVLSFSARSSAPASRVAILRRIGSVCCRSLSEDRRGSECYAHKHHIARPAEHCSTALSVRMSCWR